MSAQPIIDALEAKLLADVSAGTFVDALGGRLFYGIGGQNQDLPCCTWFVVTSDIERHFGSARSYEVLFQFDVYAAIDAGPKAAANINDKLDTLIDNTSITPSGFDRGVVTITGPGTPVKEEDAWRITNEVLVRGTDF